MNNEKYNGWTNYETWKVNLELLDGVTAKDLFGRKCEGEEVQEYIEDLTYDQCQPRSFSRDCVLLFLSNVNWDEIAEHLNED
jgi:hypothetical protein